MKAFLHCVCQSRMHLDNGIARCVNGACKHFGKEFHAPDLELKEVGSAITEAPVPAAAAPVAAEASAPAAEPAASTEVQEG